MRTLSDAFRDYVAVEMLDGENMYQAEGFGLQDGSERYYLSVIPASAAFAVEALRVRHATRCYGQGTCYLSMTEPLMTF
jgi:hypothetical protein